MTKTETLIALALFILGAIGMTIIITNDTTDYEVHSGPQGLAP